MTTFETAEGINIIAATIADGTRAEIHADGWDGLVLRLGKTFVEVKKTGSWTDGAADLSLEAYTREGAREDQFAYADFDDVNDGYKAADFIAEAFGFENDEDAKDAVERLVSMRFFF
jgi:hypothetical protein